MEYIIKRTDGDWFDLDKNKMGDVFYIEGGQLFEGRGDYCLKTKSGMLTVSYEDPGLQVAFEDFSKDQAEELINNMLRKLEEITGQKGEILPI